VEATATDETFADDYIGGDDRSESVTSSSRSADLAIVGQRGEVAKIGLRVRFKVRRCLYLCTRLAWLTVDFSLPSLLTRLAEHACADDISR
jgi:hypothetical protein